MDPPDIDSGLGSPAIPREPIRIEAFTHNVILSALGEEKFLWYAFKQPLPAFLTRGIGVWGSPRSPPFLSLPSRFMLKPRGIFLYTSKVPDVPKFPVPNGSTDYLWVIRDSYGGCVQTLWMPLHRGL